MSQIIKKATLAAIRKEIRAASYLYESKGDSGERFLTQGLDFEFSKKPNDWELIVRNTDFGGYGWHDIVTVRLSDEEKAKLVAWIGKYVTPCP